MTTQVILPPDLSYPVTIVGLHVAKGQRIAKGDLLYTLQDATGAIIPFKAEADGLVEHDPLPINSIFAISVPVLMLGPLHASRPEPKPTPKPAPAAKDVSGDAEFRKKVDAALSFDSPKSGGVPGFFLAVLAWPLFVAVGFVMATIEDDDFGLMGAVIFGLVFLFAVGATGRVSLAQWGLGILASIGVTVGMMQMTTDAVRDLPRTIASLELPAFGEPEVLPDPVERVVRSSLTQAPKVATFVCEPYAPSGSLSEKSYSDFWSRTSAAHAIASSACADAGRCMELRRTCNQDVTTRRGCEAFSDCMAAQFTSSQRSESCQYAWDDDRGLCRNTNRSSDLVRLRCPGFGDALGPRDTGMTCGLHQRFALKSESEANELAKAYNASCPKKRPEFTCEAIP